MSEEDNRDVGNLLLLCLMHAWEVDETPDLYPADMLRFWKRDQLDQYRRARKCWTITDSEAEEAVAPLDLTAAIEAISQVVPFNPRMRSRVETWQLAVRKGHGRRRARLTPLVNAVRRDAVMAWMAALDDPIVDVPAGQVRVLVARLGAGKSEQAARWWEQGLQTVVNDPETEVPLHFDPRHISSSLEHAIVTELGHDPTRICRVVIDDLDSVPAQQADWLLTEARQLVQVWPMVSVLATARPGLAVPAEEKITIAPWPALLGSKLAEVAIGEPVPTHLWTTETTDLLASPLTALALAARVQAGRDTKVSRAQLLANLTPTVIESHHIDMTDETWHDLAQLAVTTLTQPEPATINTYNSLPRLRRLLATDLVVRDENTVAFALPVLEQYFGSEAIKSGLVNLEHAAAATSFPRWRYALTFAMASTATQVQETLLLKLARINPAAAFWIVDELTDTDATSEHDGPSDDELAAVIRCRCPQGVPDEPDLAVRAGVWLREAEQALLTGLGPLAESLVRHRDGKLVQWGVWLKDGYLTLARARDTPPPPEVVKLTRARPGLAEGWHRITQFAFPTENFGRWHVAQRELQEQLRTKIVRQTLAVPPKSMLARERTYYLASFVHDYGVSRRRRPIGLAEVRDTVATWMDKVNASEFARWQSTGRTVDSNDIRWLTTQLALEDDDTLHAPWPSADQPDAGKWVWQAYSPDLTLTMATSIVREAIVGYHQLVELNFPAFGDALGLHSMLPLRVEGLVERPIDDNAYSINLILAFEPAPQHAIDLPDVELRLLAKNASDIVWKFAADHRGSGRTLFGQKPIQHLELPLHSHSPATILAYKWLARDLATIGWLKDHHRLT